MSLPHIFVLDWDGTIAGKVDFQSYAFNIRSTLKEHGFKPASVQSPYPKAFAPSSKLIRPGFTAFIRAMNEYFHGNVYFFVYTASEKSWAQQEITWFEKAHGVKLQRPIFARDDCILDASGSYKKSIARIFPRICRVIAKDKPLSKQEKNAILTNNLIIIDNNAVYIDHTDRLLICPTYNYMVFEHLYDIIPATARQHPEVRQLMLSLINAGAMCPFPTSDDEMQLIYSKHAWIAATCKSIVEVNKQHIQDDFWKRLRRLIVKNDIRTFKVSVLIRLQNAIWKSHHTE